MFVWNRRQIEQESGNIFSTNDIPYVKHRLPHKEAYVFVNKHLYEFEKGEEIFQYNDDAERGNTDHRLSESSGYVAMIIGRPYGAFGLFSEIKSPVPVGAVVFGQISGDTLPVFQKIQKMGKNKTPYEIVSCGLF